MDLELLQACYENDLGKVRSLLLDHGADPNLRDFRGWNAMIKASCYGRIEIIRLLLDHGIDPNFQDYDGCTVLMMASGGRGHIDMVRLLLDHGADPNLQNKYGQDALVWASKRGHIDVVELLKAAVWNRNVAQPLTDLDIFPEGLIREHLTV
jgi:ankyrin repeat protein